MMVLNPLDGLKYPDKCHKKNYKKFAGFLGSVHNYYCQNCEEKIFFGRGDSHKLYGKWFCSEKCKEEFRATLKKEIGRIKEGELPK